MGTSSRSRSVFLLLFSTLLYLAVPGLDRFGEGAGTPVQGGSFPFTYLTSGTGFNDTPFIPPERSFTSQQFRSLSKAFSRGLSEFLTFRAVHLPWPSLTSDLGRSLFCPCRSRDPIWLTCLSLLI